MRTEQEIKELRNFYMHIIDDESEDTYIKEKYMSKARLLYWVLGYNDIPEHLVNKIED